MNGVERFIKFFGTKSIHGDDGDVRVFGFERLRTQFIDTYERYLAIKDDPTWSTPKFPVYIVVDIYTTRDIGCDVYNYIIKRIEANFNFQLHRYGKAQSASYLKVSIQPDQLDEDAIGSIDHEVSKSFDRMMKKTEQNQCLVNRDMNVERIINFTIDDLEEMMQMIRFTNQL